MRAFDQQKPQIWHVPCSLYASIPSIGGDAGTFARLGLVHYSPACIWQLQAYFVSPQGWPALHVIAAPCAELLMQITLQLQGLHQHLASYRTGRLDWGPNF